MKKILTLFILVVCGQITVAQVGIGTNSPTTNFHIKSTQDYIFTLRDGIINGDSYVLTSPNTAGFIKKQTTNIFKTVKFAKLNESAEVKNLIIPPNENYVQKFTGEWNGVRDAEIELPFGKWAVYITTLITLDNFDQVPEFRNTAITADVMMVDYDDYAAKIYNKPSADIEGDSKDSVNGYGFVSGALVFPNRKEVIKGIIIINNDDPQRRLIKYKFAMRVSVNTEQEFAFNLFKLKTLTGILSDDHPQTQVYAIPLN